MSNYYLKSFYIIGNNLYKNMSHYDNTILINNPIKFNINKLKENYTNKLTKQLFDLNNELDLCIKKYNSNKNTFVTESFEKKIILLETIIYKINKQLIKMQCLPNP